MSNGEVANMEEPTHQNKGVEDDYRMLADIIKHQHDRVRDHTTVFMSILSALAGFIVFFIAEHTRLPFLAKYLLVLLAACGGCAASLAWFLVLHRIFKDTELRYAQLRRCENAMKRRHGVFTEGHHLFFAREASATLQDGSISLTLDWRSRTSVRSILSRLAMAYASCFVLFVVLSLLKIACALFKYLC